MPRDCKCLRLLATSHCLRDGCTTISNLVSPHPMRNTWTTCNLVSADEFKSTRPWRMLTSSGPLGKLWIGCAQVRSLGTHMRISGKMELCTRWPFTVGRSSTWMWWSPTTRRGL
ncbi:hypothetical protein Syun_017515 [Stephania yunnanensis]|uniref:Uncharacterized protein n=1 Tax=Stephania yunnanensis TaxID=152371 RepID=A0AAP0J9C1_9MAGN